MKSKLQKFCLLLLVAFLFCGKAKSAVIDDLRKWLATPVAERGDVDRQSFANKSLSQEEAGRVLRLLQDEYYRHQHERFDEIWKKQSFSRDTLTMKFMYRVYGEKPADGRSLYISMHGGGGTTPEVNDGQWNNQIRLYQPEEGVYVAPRSLHNVWNMWCLPYLDGFFDELIQSAVVIMGVNPDKVYITGYSAGGDGTFRMAPRMSDRWAAALMCAGHPGNTSPVGLRNLPFGMWVGIEDTAYDRHQHGIEWCAALKALRDLDPDGYISNTKMLPTGHWMNRMDTVAFKWMGQFTRNPYPDKVVWKQDSTDLNKAMYWLSMPEEKLQLGGLIIVSHNGNEFIIERSYTDELTIGLNDKMIDYSKPVVVRYRGKEVFRGKVKRTVASLYKSYISRHDDRYGFSTVLNLKLD